jgi:hypothetical protein
MKLLVAIQSKKPKQVKDRTLRWAGRAGYDTRIFVPKGKRGRFILAVQDANYDYYLAVEDSQVIDRQTPMEYAQRHGYDLVLLLPEKLWSWRDDKKFQEDEVVYYVEDVGAARKEFSTKPGLAQYRFPNGAVMLPVPK